MDSKEFFLKVKRLRELAWMTAQTKAPEVIDQYHQVAHEVDVEIERVVQQTEGKAWLNIQ